MLETNPHIWPHADCHLPTTITRTCLGILYLSPGHVLILELANQQECSLGVCIAVWQTDRHGRQGKHVEPSSVPSHEHRWSQDNIPDPDLCAGYVSWSSLNLSFMANSYFLGYVAVAHWHVQQAYVLCILL